MPEEVENSLNEGTVVTIVLIFGISLYTTSGAAGISKSPIGQFVCYLLYYSLL